MCKPVALPDYAAIVELLAQAPDERVEDVIAFYPHAQGVLWILEKLDAGELDEAALELERWCGEHARDRLPDGFAPVFGGKLHGAMLAARKEDEWHASLTLDFVSDEQVMLVTDDERLFCSQEGEDGEWEQGLDVLWPQLSVVIYDLDAHGGRGEARAYASAEEAAQFALPGQQVEPVVYPVVDYDVFTTVYVLPTRAGWKVWKTV